MITKKIAEKIGVVEYSWEPSGDLCREAAQNKYVIVFGASDDLCELRGWITAEFGCYNGGEIHSDALSAAGVQLKAIWSDKAKDWSWRYSVNKPFSTFWMLDDREKYCEGIVFSLE